MSSPADYGVLLTTVPSRDEAAKIAHLLIDEKLAAKFPYQPAYLPVNRLQDGTMWNW